MHIIRIITKSFVISILGIISKNLAQDTLRVRVIIGSMCWERCSFFKLWAWDKNNYTAEASEIINSFPFFYSMMFNFSFLHRLKLFVCSSVSSLLYTIRLKVYSFIFLFSIYRLVTCYYFYILLYLNDSEWNRPLFDKKF